MAEYIVKETVCQLATRQEVIGELVRCKECKHRDPEDKKCDCGHGIAWNLPRPDDWFCPDAEWDEPQTESPCSTCQEFDCYGCEYKQTERSE